MVVSERATKTESSSLGLKPGERLPLDTLLTALLLKSANDAAVAIAEHVGGSVEGFANLMNARAKQLGANDSHFVNPNGLYDPNHYSSAYDLALFTREALKQPRFRELVRTKVVDIQRPDLKLKEPMINHNKLLWRDDSVDGVKTGFVKESGHCLVASATRNDWQLIAVVLDSQNMYAETEALLQWGFTQFHQRVLAKPGDAIGQARVGYGQKRSVTAVCEFPLGIAEGPGLARDAHVKAIFAKKLYAPVQIGQQVGIADLIVGGKVVATSPLVAKESVPKSYALVGLVWMVRIVGILACLACAIRVNAKIIKTRRRRRRGFPPQGGRSGARGRVRVDGQVVDHPGTLVDEDRAEITVDGRPVQMQQKIYLLLNKPRWTYFRGRGPARPEDRGRSAGNYRRAALPRGPAGCGHGGTAPHHERRRSDLPAHPSQPPGGQGVRGRGGGDSDPGRVAPAEEGGGTGGRPDRTGGDAVVVERAGVVGGGIDYSRRAKAAGQEDAAGRGASGAGAPKSAGGPAHPGRIASRGVATPHGGGSARAAGGHRKGRPLGGAASNLRNRRRLGDANDLTRLEALGAHPLGNGRLALHSFHRLQIRQPPPLGKPVGVADVMSGLRTFSANFANSRHEDAPGSV